MGVRLNKVLTELNIGLQTAVDFLRNKKRLGEIREDATSNTKISDEQYEALVQEFSGDKAVKTQADKLFPKKKEKKPEKPVVKAQPEELPSQPRQQFKPLGKIDLDSIGKPKPVVKPAVPEVTEPEPATAAESQAPVEIEETPVVVEEKISEPVVEQEVEQEDVVEPADQDTEKLPEDDADEFDEADEAEQPAEQAPAGGPEIYTLKSEAKLAPKVNVLGKIDLSAIKDRKSVV